MEQIVDASVIRRDRLMGSINLCLEHNKLDKKILYFIFIVNQLPQELRDNLDLDNMAEKFKKKLKNIQFRIKVDLYYKILDSPDESRILLEPRGDSEPIYNMEFYMEEYKFIVETEIELSELLGNILFQLSEEEGMGDLSGFTKDEKTKTAK